MLFRIFILCLLASLGVACSRPGPDSVRIAINPWPGYEFLYLAEYKGYFEITGANVSLVQLGSLGDAQRAYVNGRVEGFASTMIEAVQAEHWGGEPLKITMIADYSNGGDVIITGSDRSSMGDLKSNCFPIPTICKPLLSIYVKPWWT